MAPVTLICFGVFEVTFKIKVKIYSNVLQEFFPYDKYNVTTTSTYADDTQIFYAEMMLLLIVISKG